jgi:hypothetical protein
VPLSHRCSGYHLSRRAIASFSVCNTACCCQGAIQASCEGAANVAPQPLISAGGIPGFAVGSLRRAAAGKGTAPPLHLVSMVLPNLCIIWWLGLLNTYRMLELRCRAYFGLVLGQGAVLAGFAAGYAYRQVRLHLNLGTWAWQPTHFARTRSCLV